MKINKFLFPVHLQTFAEGGQGEQDGEPGGQQTGATNNAQVYSLDEVQKWLDEDSEGKKWHQSYGDAIVTKAIKTYEEKTLPKKVEEEITKRFPPETEEQKQYRELKQQFEDEKQLRVRTEMKNKAMAVATEKSLPSTLVDFFIGADEEATVANLGLLEQAFNAAVQTAVEATFKNNGRTPYDTGSQSPDSLKKQLEEAAERARKSGRDEDLAAYSRLKLQMMQQNNN